MVQEISQAEFEKLKSDIPNPPFIFNWCPDVWCSNDNVDATKFDLLAELDIRQVPGTDCNIAICAIYDYMRDGKIIFSRDDLYRDAIVYVLIHPNCRILMSGNSFNKRPILEYITPDMVDSDHPTNMKFKTILRNKDAEITRTKEWGDVMNKINKEGITKMKTQPNVQDEYIAKMLELKQKYDELLKFTQQPPRQNRESQ